MRNRQWNRVVRYWPGGLAKKALTLSTEVERRGLPCRVTTVERTLVDVLDRPDLAGGLEAVWRSLSSVPLFDLNVVVNYVRLCGQATLAAKVGVFLERRQAVFGVPRTVLERLRRMRPKQPHYLDRTLGGKMAPGWNLMVPALVESEPSGTKIQSYST